MNFLLRTTQNAVADQSSIHESPSGMQHVSKSAETLEGLNAESLYFPSATDDNCAGEIDGVRNEIGSVAATSTKDAHGVEKYLDVTEDEGWISVPYRELPDNWSDAPSINSFRSLDRSFVFPGEQVHILACLSASRQCTEIITPFKVAAVMNRNGHDMHNIEDLLKETDVFAGESLLRMEDHKRQTETLLQRFLNSHFFVRISESDEPLWSKRSGSPEALSETSKALCEKVMENEHRETLKKTFSPTTDIDRGNFNANAASGLARTVKCCSLSNGDIAVLLEVNVCVGNLRDPVLEILQFEKFQDYLSSENQDNLAYANHDPCGELLKWLLPLDNAMPPPPQPLCPPPLSTSSGIGSASQRSNFPTSSGTQLFSFGHLRSYSMSSLPQNTVLQPSSVMAPSSRTSAELEDLDQFASQKIFRSKKTSSEELLSFRGVPLVPERFSVCCGLEGIYIPGRRWRKKIEIIQPVEISSFSADCNTDDLLCVQIKNIAPDHAPDIMIFVDAITIILEEASKGGPPTSLPIACIEAGNDDNLPNLPLRRGEEHSFILKPASPAWKNNKAYDEKSSKSSHFRSEIAASSFQLPSKIMRSSASIPDQYALLVSCRCNLTESRLFFKKPTSWKPRTSRDLMISVASEMSRQSLGPRGGVSQSQLPVQVLNLQASNLTSEDMTLTVLAPASFTSPPSILSLNSSPTTPMSPFIEFAEFTGTAGNDRATEMQRLESASLISATPNQNDDGGAQPVMANEPVVPHSGVTQSPDPCCTHLWLQSRVPLGCIPSQSMATIKLELLPLTDGIITLDTLQIDVKEKGLTYVPENSLKIHATSSISTGIV